MASGATKPLELPKAPAPGQLSFRAQWAARAIRSNLGQIQKEAPPLPDNAGVNLLSPVKNTLYTGKDQNPTFRVGIVGAGVAGLFTAMIFDHLKEEFGLNVDYEILEASADNRLGGRLYTYYFPDTEGHPEIGPHDYYDVGAMRFPDIPIMQRTFELFKELDMRKNPETSPKHPAHKGELIEYYFKSPNQPMLYNNIQLVSEEKSKGYTAKDFKITDLPPDIEDKGADDLVQKSIKKFTEAYDPEHPENFWKILLEEADPFSVRQWLTKAGYNYNTIEFLETLNTGNRWYDQALSEMIIESLDFDAKAKWWCVEGGSQETAYRMRQKIKQQQAIHFKRIVKGMTYVDEKNDEIDVTIKGEKTPRRYDAVFNSVPLGAMQHMSLEGLNLNWGTKSAIRSLGYGASCKVGIRFKSLWWIKEFGIKGGVAKTDLPIRCCVYPSYNIDDPVERPGVLLVSYTWSQEAERIGALINRNSPHDEDKLKGVLIHDLARLHAKTKDDEDYQRLHKIISADYLSHYAYNWYADPNSVGAFAYFGPGQFQNMYQWITRSDGKHIIIGEAASAHHAWVVGALESAIRGVYQFLWKHSEHSKAAHEAALAYVCDQVKGPFGPVPAEYDRTADIRAPTLPSAPAGVKEAVQPSPIGDLARFQVLVETIRLRQGGDKIDSKHITKADLKPMWSF